ncbi:hypothetical protein [Cypionkella sp.]|uniref:hypothetical protein n=1 Tax=Cypionkella sp. TaxID=2811411 RepID=UPI0026305B82|nr:hypothetical protein [Cypionkella sp.]MDB5666690.1 peptide methionine sulfoxide reductase [Cypionkella sp.]
MDADAFRTALSLIPEGYSEGLYLGQRWRLEKTTYTHGRSVKFYARSLGGTDFVSLNLYHLAAGDVLKPCEMAEDKVRDFVLGVVVEAQL